MGGKAAPARDVRFPMAAEAAAAAGRGVRAERHADGEAARCRRRGPTNGRRDASGGRPRGIALAARSRHAHTGRQRAGVGVGGAAGDGAARVVEQVSEDPGGLLRRRSRGSRAAAGARR